ncbi:MAG: mechanosensitive ion channel family protein [Pseudomonadota bacterium]
MENETDLAAEATSAADFDATISTISGLIEGFFALLPKLGIAIVLFAAFLVVASIIRRVIKRLTRGKKQSGLGDALGRLGHIATVFAGFLVAISVIAPSVGAAELLSVLGVGSVAIGFAFRDILQNFLAGILILVREPFTVGDWVRFGDYEGIVRSISTRSTWIRSFDGRDIAIPNGEVFTNAMTVVTHSDTLRGQYEFGIAYEADLKQAMSIILKTVQAHPKVLADPAPDVGVCDLAGSSVNLRARWWTANSDFYWTKLNIIKDVKLALDAQGIDIPFPMRTLELSESTRELLDRETFRQAAE